MSDGAVHKNDATTTLFTTAADEVTYTGVANSKLQAVTFGAVSGSAGSRVFNAVFAAIANATTAYGLAVREVPATLPKHIVSAATDNAQNVLASAGVVRCVSGFNNAAYPVYAKFHNNAGTPTAGAGVVWTVAFQAGSANNVSPPGGVRFSTGVAVTIVKDITNAGTTAVALSDLVLDVFYEA